MLTCCCEFYDVRTYIHTYMPCHTPLKAAAKTIKPSPTEVVADIFARLVPMKVHLAASEFSELKAQLARQINSEIAEKDMELEHALRKMDLITGGINERNVEIPPVVFQKGTCVKK